MRLYIHNRMEQSTNDKKDAIVFALSSSGSNSRRATTWTTDEAIWVGPN